MQGTVIYHVPFEGVSWSQLFWQWEENKQRLNIIDYSVSQTTLEQVFVYSVGCRICPFVHNYGHKFSSRVPAPFEYHNTIMFCM